MAISSSSGPNVLARLITICVLLQTTLNSVTASTPLNCSSPISCSLPSQTTSFAPSNSSICGSDGLTYPTSCHFSLAACTNTTLTSTPGPCNPCPTICTLQYSPICGSNGQVYGNTCFFNAAVCANSFLYHAFNGDCLTRSCARVCGGSERVMVCGSDGRTYGSDCELENVACGLATGGLALVKVADGICREGMTFVTGSGGGVANTTAGSGPIAVPVTCGSKKAVGTSIMWTGVASILLFSNIGYHYF